MDILTKKQVIDRLKAYCRKYINQSEAAKAIGCTNAQLSDALNDRKPPCGSILKALKIERGPLYVSGIIQPRFQDGCLRMD